MVVAREAVRLEGGWLRRSRGGCQSSTLAIVDVLARPCRGRVDGGVMRSVMELGVGWSRLLAPITPNSQLSDPKVSKPIG